MHQLLSEAIYKPLLDILPYIPQRLAPWAGKTLGNIAEEYTKAPTDEAPSKALIDCLADMTRPVLGESAAKALSQRLQRCPAVLSANHHGFDCLPEMVQAIHFFGLHDLLHQDPQQNSASAQNEDAADCSRIIPVLSCSGVPLQSSFYPRGLMPARQDVHGKRLHLPLFPSALQDTLVLCAPALTAEGVHTMRQRWPLDALDKWELEAAHALLEEHILTPEVLSLPHFSDQAMRINATLCAQRFPGSPQTSVAYLDLEEASRRMLMLDLGNPQSVMYRMLFTTSLRDKALHALSGKRGCWSKNAALGKELSRTGSDGTIFFWTIDAQGRRCPLRLVPGKTCGTMALEYKEFRVELSPNALIEALQARRIYPCLLSTYISLELEHHLRCYGGIFLVNYLPDMLHTVMQVFQSEGEELPAFTPYLALAAVTLTVQTLSAGRPTPAGALELAAAGGIGQSHIEKLAALSVMEVLPLSMKEWCLTYVPKAQHSQQWLAELNKGAEQWRGLVLPCPRAN